MDQKILPRNLEPVIEQAMVPQRVVLIFGARRVGKTILLESVLSRMKGKVMLLNGDDEDTIRLLEERSISNYSRLLKGIDILAIDEAQQIPDIGNKLKLIVDKNLSRRWDYGDYNNRVLPEEIIYFDKTISIRKNWDVEEEWLF